MLNNIRQELLLSKEEYIDNRKTTIISEEEKMKQITNELHKQKKYHMFEFIKRNKDKKGMKI